MRTDGGVYHIGSLPSYQDHPDVRPGCELLESLLHVDVLGFGIHDEVVGPLVFGHLPDTT